MLKNLHMAHAVVKELKEKKEYKVVIRDPKDSSLNIFKKLGRIWILFVKFLIRVIGLYFLQAHKAVNTPIITSGVTLPSIP